MRKPKKNRSAVYLAIFIIAIMVFSVFMVLTDSGSNQSKYNGFKFQFVNNQWITKINGQEISFFYHPSELDDISTPDLAIIKEKPQLYLTFDPNITQPQYLDLSRLKLKMFLIQNLNQYVIEGINQPDTDYNLPILTCQNATGNVPVIFYQIGNQTSVTIKNNCFIIDAQTPSDILKITEKIIYILAGVIKNG